MSGAYSYNYAWAPPNQTPVIERPMRGKNITLIGAISLQGPVAMRRVEHSVNGEEFVSFLREDLGPKLPPGAIVVMDGPKIHRVAGVKEALDEFGATALYIPAYTPELNPIEMTWSWFKHLFRAEAPRRITHIRALISKIWAAVPKEFCVNWIRHAGYSVAPST